MNRTIDRLRIVFLVVFAVACAGVWAYQILYVWPAKKCEQRGRWWSNKFRECDRVIYLPEYTKAYRRMQGVAAPQDPVTSGETPDVKAKAGPAAKPKAG